MRFTTSDGTTLVYDYYWTAPDPAGQSMIGQWSTFTRQPAVDATLFGTRYVYVKANGQVLGETPNSYLDDGLFYALTVETANIAAVGSQGLFRCRRAYLLGTYSSPHTLNVDIAYNYGDYIQTQQWRTDQAISTTTWGSDPFWGSGPIWGGLNDSVYQVRINPARQRVQAIRFRFSDQPLASNVAGAAYSLTSLALEIGAKKGLFKLGMPKTAR